MPRSPLRNTLRHGTDDLHRVLDAAMGTLDSAEAYHAYLRGTHAFRAALEPALAGSAERAGWTLMPLVPDLAQDLRACGLRSAPAPRTMPLPAPNPHGPGAIADLAGALYVIEGSGLGAVLIARRVAALGALPATARTHLARQTGDPRRWPRFLAWLEASDADPARAVSMARAVFALALSSYGVAPPADAPASAPRGPITS